MQTPIWWTFNRVWYRQDTDTVEIHYGINPPADGEWAGQTEIRAVARKRGQDYGVSVSVTDANRAFNPYLVTVELMEEAMRSALGEPYVGVMV